MAMLRERGVVLEVCPSSNLNTRVIGSHAEMRTVLRSLVDNGVRFALSTDGPEMLRSYLRDEVALLLRLEILSLDEVLAALRTADEASFVGRRASAPRRNGKGNGQSPRAAIALEVEV
jgi:adenosine deaminase